jgi:hypothetical protein
MRPAVGGGLAEAVELGGGGVEADLSPFGFTEPAVTSGFADAFAEVAGRSDITLNEGMQMLVMPSVRV